MPPWLTIWFWRWSLGERFRKAQAWDFRYWVGSLFLVPLFVMGALTFGNRIFDLSGIQLWLGFTGVCLVGYIGVNLWARSIPWRVSAILSIISWAGFYYWIAR
jgi:hypothetical protein